MDTELIINSFWFLSIFTAALYIAKKRYLNKKEYKLLDKAFKFCFALSVLLICVSFYFLIK